MQINRPQVGVGVTIRNNGLILLAKRKSNHAYGMWSTPGGHLEYGESFEECAIREVKEETGIILEEVKFWHVQNTIFPNENKHYVLILMVADMPKYQKPLSLEPDKNGPWDWYSWKNLPTPLMPGTRQALEQGLNPFLCS